MPRRDKTGPMGQGAQTGRGLGPCGGQTSRTSRPGSGLMQRAGRMFRRNRGMGRKGRGDQGFGPNGSNKP